MTDTLNPTLDWHPPSEFRKEANQPYRLFAQAGFEDTKDLNLELTARGRNWLRKLWLDQLNEGACTGFGLGHCLGMGYKSHQISDQQARQLYKWAQFFDRWAGEDYEGSSVQGAMEGAKHQGIITGYWWIETPAELQAAISRYGVVEAGTFWLQGMWRPDANGYVHATGNSEGGHAYALGGYDKNRGRYRIDNSWGKNKWGVNGSAYIDQDEFHALAFEMNGEIALPRKKKVIPASAWTTIPQP